jgi:predicted alpha/beta-fold hydrolase
VLRGEAHAPTVLLLHGLEGSSRASYIQVLLRLLAERGWNAWALNFRGCSGEPNRTLAAYCSGDTRDLAFLVPQLPNRRYAIGFSLGASVVLNGLARLDVPLDGAVAVSPPFRLEVSAKAIDAGLRDFGPLYLNHFLPALKRKALEMATRFPGVLDAEVISRVRKIRDFDHHVTARTFGFSSAEDYYEQCSSAPWLGKIRRRTLIITAEDDAIAPAAGLPTTPLPECVDLLRTKHGGHVGWASGSLVRPQWWAEQKAVEWLARLDAGG